MTIATVIITAGIPLVSALLYCFRAAYRHRCKINRLRKQGMTMPEWSWFMGHLLVMDRYVGRLPDNGNVYMAMNELAREHEATEIFLMDFWPIFSPVLMVSGSELAVQASDTYNLQKPASLAKGIKPIIGGPSILTMNGEEWKKWRALFNPGFSAANMMDLVPTIVDSVQIFCDILKANTKTGMFCLDDLTMRLTMDIITKLTLDTDLDNQRSEHLISKCLKTIWAWHSFYDPFILLNPLRPFVQKYHWNRMNNFIQSELRKRFSEMKMASLSTSNTSKPVIKSVISLALKEYFKQQDQVTELTQLDKGFADIVGNQIRLFLLAGNDTTSTTIVYIYYLLSKHPEALARVREEHDSVFGSNPTNIADILKETPTLINKCRYTLAVIKETLRLFPPSSSLREGRAPVAITDRQGNVYPTEGLDITIMHLSVHTNPVSGLVHWISYQSGG